MRRLLVRDGVDAATSVKGKLAPGEGQYTRWLLNAGGTEFPADFQDYLATRES